MKTRTLLRKTTEIEAEKDKFVQINKKDETNYCFPLRIQTLDYRSESESGSVALTGRGVTPISTEAREEEEKRSGRVYTERGENHLIAAKLEYNEGTGQMRFFAVPRTRSRRENTDLYYPIIYRTRHRPPPIDGSRAAPH